MLFSIPEIQTGTLLLATATFFGALIGSITQLILNWYAKQETKRNLRIALKSELEAGGATLRLNPNSYDMYREFLRNTPREVFDAHISDIGSLSEEEVSNIVRYYSLISPSIELIQFLEKPANEIEDIFQEMQQVLEKEGIDEKQLPTDIQNDVESARDFVERAGERDVEYFLETLDDARENALNAIDKHL